MRNGFETAEHPNGVGADGEPLAVCGCTADEREIAESDRHRNLTEDKIDDLVDARGFVRVETFAYLVELAYREGHEAGTRSHPLHTETNWQQSRIRESLKDLI